MLLSEIHTNIYTELSKDGNEGVLSEDRFNGLLNPCFYELIRNESIENKVLLENGNEEIISLGVLKDLVYTKSSAAVSTGIMALTTAVIGADMLYWGVMKGTNTINGKRRKVRLVNYHEYMSRFSNMMKLNIDEEPIAYLYTESGSYYCQILPTNIQYVDFIFIKKPTLNDLSMAPFLDYYMDADYKTQFLAAGASYTLQASEQYRDGTTSGLKTSQTKELELPVDYHPKFQDLMLEKISLLLDDQYKNQYSLAKSQQP